MNSNHSYQIDTLAPKFTGEEIVWEMLEKLVAGILSEDMDPLTSYNEK